jgi:NitT/TauT family transport system substrate-binding protein
MGVIPYTNTLAASTRSPTFSIVAGSGIQGLIVVAKPEISLPDTFPTWGFFT